MSGAARGNPKLLGGSHAVPMTHMSSFVMTYDDEPDVWKRGHLRLWEGEYD